MTQAPFIHPTIAFSSPFGSKANKPIGKKGAARMEDGFIARTMRTTPPQAANQSPHLVEMGIRSFSFVFTPFIRNAPGMILVWRD